MRIRRTLVNALIRSVIPAVVGLVVWVGGYMFVMSYVTGSGYGSGKKFYKNYTEQPFLEEIVSDKNILLQRSLENKLLDKKKLMQGTFVVVRVDGVISGEGYQDIYDQLYIAGRLTHNLKAIIFIVDSPGGSVTASDNLYEEIRKFKSRGYKVVTFVNSMSASGAYYITANSDRIIAAPTSLVGSIGVIMEWYNFQGLAGKIGVKEETVKSSEMKDIGSPFKKMSDQERDVLQKVVNQSYARFKNIVKVGRRMSDIEVGRVATGEVWTAQDAKRLGLVDDVGYVSQAIYSAKQLTGVEFPSVVIYRQERGFFDIFGVNSSVANLISNLDSKISRNFMPGPQLLYQWIP